MTEKVYLFLKEYTTDPSGQKFFPSPNSVRVLDEALQARIEQQGPDVASEQTALRGVPAQIAALQSTVVAAAEGYQFYELKSEMDLVVDGATGDLARVWGDGANNGDYAFDEGSPGSWSETEYQPVTGADYDDEVGAADGDGDLFTRVAAVEVSGVAPDQLGDWRWAATEAVTGGPADVAPAESSSVASTDVGNVLRAVGQVIFALRTPIFITPGRYYELTYEYRRVSDPVDESVSSVQRAVRWLDADYDQVTTTVDYDEACTIAAGVMRVTLLIGPDDGPVVPDISIPSGAACFRPYLRFTGSDQTSDAIAIRWREFVLRPNAVQRQITVTDGRIIVAGDSLSAYHYGPEYSSWIALLGGLTDWQIDSYSRAGDDTLEILSRILDGTNDYGGQSFDDMDGAYVIVPMFANDVLTRYLSTRRWVENYRRLLIAIKASGARPILCTEGRKYRGIEQAATSRLARELDIPYWEITGEWFTHDSTRNDDYWGSNHPGARHTHQYKNLFRRRIAELGRPDCAIKAFRPRYRRQIAAPAASWTFAGGSLLSQPDESYVGTLVGSAAIVDDSERGKVYEGTTTGDRMTIGGSYVLPQSYTIAAWIKPTALSGNQNILSGATTSRHTFMLTGSSIYGRHAGTSPLINSASGLTAGVWSHVALTYDAVTEEMVAYVDGEEVARQQAVPNHSSSNLQIGSSGTANSFVGRIDDAAVYDRALLPDEVKAVAYHLDSLLFDDLPTRAAHWREIRTGHHSMDADTVPYFDELDGLTYAFTAQPSEYLTWQAGSDLSFTDYALFEIVLPATATKTGWLVVNLPGAAAASVCAMNRQRALEDDPYVRNYMFRVGSTMPAAAAGDTYTFDSVTYTIVGVIPDREVYGEWIVTATASPDPNGTDLGAGTLTRAAGSGDATIDFTDTFGFNGSDIYSTLYSPTGEWVEQSGSNGVFHFARADLKGLLEYDKLTLVVKKRGAFTLGAPIVHWSGVPGKDRSLPAPPKHLSGTELLTDTDFEDFGASNWATEGTVLAAAPADGVLPYGVTKCVTLSDVNRLTQPVTITADALLPKRLQLLIRCRYAPDKFVASGTLATAKVEYAQKSPITSDTFGHAVLVAALTNGVDYHRVESRELVGLAPEDVLIDLDIPSARAWEDSSCELRLWAESPYRSEALEIQVYEVHLISTG